MPSYGTRAVRFSVFEVDLRAGELRRNGVKVKIQNQPFQILGMLLERPGEIITRDEMRARLWPVETFVDFDHGLNSAIRRLRDALGDSAESPTFVETLGRRGYRFVFPVEKLPIERPNGDDVRTHSGLAEVVPISGPEPSYESPEPPPVRQHWELKVALAVAVVGVVAAALLLANGDSYLSGTRLGVSARSLFGRSRAVAQPTLTQRRLTANTDDAPLTGGVISPDGKYLAYTEPSGFYLRQVDGGETHSIPLPKGFDALPESWFPDSAHLVVTWFGDQRNPPRSGIPRAGPPSLWKISILGGTPQKLADEGSSARVSPDGSKIVYLAGPWDSEQVWLMDADGSNAKKIIDGSEQTFGAVGWAPDGKRFAYIRTIVHPPPDRPGKQIEIYDVASGRGGVILSDPLLGDAIVWTSAGRLIYSLSEAEPNQGDSNLWSVQLDSANGNASVPPVRITNDRAAITGISLTADSKRMVLLRGTFQADGYVTEIEAQGKRLGPLRRLTQDEAWDWPTAWTPDSKTVVFNSDRDGPPHIFKQRIDQAQPELLVGGNDILPSAPRSTPDGLSVLYLVNASKDGSSHTSRLMRVPVSGGPSHIVLEGPGIENYSCARLPSTLCIHGEIDPKSEYNRFFTFDPEGGEGAELLVGKMKKGIGPANDWSLSPDGKYIVTPKSPNPQDEPALRIISLADCTERFIPVPEMGLMMGMDWAADSKSLWVGGYMGRGAWGTRSGLLNVDLSGRTKLMLKGLSPTIWFAIPAPDGHRLVLGALNQRSNMWLLEKF